MSNLKTKVRFIRFLEEIHTGDRIEMKEGWIITTDKITSVKTLWKIMHKIDVIEDIKDERFMIEDNWNNPLFIKT